MTDDAGRAQMWRNNYFRLLRHVRERTNAMLREIETDMARLDKAQHWTDQEREQSSPTGIPGEGER